MMSVFVGIYIGLILLVSGLSITLGDRLSFYLILLLPFVIFSDFFWKKINILFPKKITLTWIGFSLFDLIATYLSSDKQLSIERFLLYQACFLLFVYFYNHKKSMEPVLEKIIYIFSIVFTVAYFFKDQILKIPGIIETGNIFNLFFPAIKGNNHLGIWLGMAIIILFFRKNIVVLLGLIIVYLTTFSRSSYLALTITSAIYFFKKNLLPIVVLGSAVFILGVVAFIPRDDITSDRGQYFKQAVQGFIDRPLFGYGPGNFNEISRRYAADSNGVFGSTSHNLFLDILSGSGLMAFIFFAWFLYLIIKNSQRNMFYWIVIYLLLVFSVTYIFAMPTIFFIFFISTGLSYQEKEDIKIGKLVLLWPLLVFFASILFIYSEVLYYRGDYLKSIETYPYRKDAYENLINQMEIDNKEAIYKYLSIYKERFPNLFESFHFSAYTYKRIGDNKKALKDYLAIYENRTGYNPAIAKEIQILYLMTAQEDKAWEFSKAFIGSIYRDPKKYRHMIDETYEFCVYTNTFFLDKAACF